MGQTSSSSISGSPRHKFSPLRKASTFSSQYMPGDDSPSPSTPQVERPTSPEPIVSEASGRSRVLEHAPVREDSLTDVRPGQLLHTTFPYSRGEDTGEEELVVIFEEPSSVHNDVKRNADDDIRVVSTLTQTSQHDQTSTADAEQAPPDEDNEATAPTDGPQELHPETVEPQGLALFVPADQPSDDSGAHHGAALVETDSVPPAEDSAQVLQASNIFRLLEDSSAWSGAAVGVGAQALQAGSAIFHLLEESASSGTAVEVDDEAEHAPAVPAVSATLPEPMTVHIEDAACGQGEVVEEDVVREAEGKEAEAEEAEMKPSAVQTSLPSIREEDSLPNVPAVLGSSEHLTEPVSSDDEASSVQPSPNAEPVGDERSGDESDGGADSESTSNEERTLDLVLQDREGWATDKGGLTPPVLTEPEPATTIAAPHTQAWGALGTYILTNARSGTALDLSAGDYRSVLGWLKHGHSNQQWRFVRCGKGYLIRSIVSPEHELYLTVEDGPCDGARVVASAFPASWDIVIDDEEGTMQICWPNTHFMMDLATSHWGHAASGTNVQLTKRKPHETSQTWTYTRCPDYDDYATTATLDRHHHTLTAEKVARQTLPPITAETVIVSGQDNDATVVTRTTTTTTIVTETTVTRVPRGDQTIPKARL